MASLEQRSRRSAVDNFWHRMNWAPLLELLRPGQSHARGATHQQPRASELFPRPYRLERLAEAHVVREQSAALGLELVHQKLHTLLLVRPQFRKRRKLDAAVPCLRGQPSS